MKTKFQNLQKMLVLIENSEEHKDQFPLKKLEDFFEKIDKREKNLSELLEKVNNKYVKVCDYFMIEKDKRN